MVEFDNTFARELGDLCRPWQATSAPSPSLLALDERLAAELGLDPAVLRTPEGVGLLVGNVVPVGAEPVAQAYAGHQFGGFSPRLGDGRALLVGEIIDVLGGRRDLHLKGSGRTPFARGGDGKAVVGPMLREYIMGVAMHALGIPTTRALAVVATGEPVARDTMLPGAVLARVAASHLRVGTFQFAANCEDPTLVRRLADYAITRHDPSALDAANPYLAFFQNVVQRQATLVARWMLVGFIHGVMNTDNMTVSGETIDYGPCAFMDSYDPGTVFSSIDHGGRYTFGNQPQIAQWNLARLAETMLPLFDPDTERAVAAAMEVLHAYPDTYLACWRDGMRDKLGLGDEQPSDGALIDDLLSMLRSQRVDYTSFFRALSVSLVGGDATLRSSFTDQTQLNSWLVRWQAHVDSDSAAQADRAAAMDRVNPVYIPRNHLVEDALAAATDGEMEAFNTLVDVLSAPFDLRPGLERFAEPAPASFGGYQTFCGT